MAQDDFNFMDLLEDDAWFEEPLVGRNRSLVRP